MVVPNRVYVFGLCTDIRMATTGYYTFRKTLEERVVDGWREVELSQTLRDYIWKNKIGESRSLSLNIVLMSTTHTVRF